MKIINIVFVICFILTGISSAQKVKFFENFDSLKVEDRGWVLINNDSNMVEYPVFSEPFTFTNTGLLNAYSGKYFIHYNSLNANENNLIDEWIISPEINKIEKYDRLSFWCGAVDNNYKDTLRVLISTTGNSIQDFIEIDRFKVDGPSGTWHNKVYDLTQYAGNSLYFAVNYLLKDGGVLGKNSDNVWIDNFTIESAFGPEVEVETFELEQNYPNPFNPSTNIVFSIPNDSKVQIRIYDILGKELANLVNSDFIAGRYKIVWDGLNYPSGTYFYTITSTSDNSTFEDIKQMILVK